MAELYKDNGDIVPHQEKIETEMNDRKIKFIDGGDQPGNSVPSILNCSSIHRMA